MIPKSFEFCITPSSRLQTTFVCHVMAGYYNVDESLSDRKKIKINEGCLGKNNAENADSCTSGSSERVRLKRVSASRTRRASC